MEDCLTVEMLRKFVNKIERQMSCGAEGSPHNFADYYVVVPLGANEDPAVVELIESMPPYRCNICGVYSRERS